MRYEKALTVMTLIIVVVSSFACVFGVFSNQGAGKYEIRSFYGQTVSIYGKGIYRNDSVSMVAQSKAQDIVTLVLGVPLILLSLHLSKKNQIKGRLLLTGTLGYFLYTYVSYTFLHMYDEFFMIYIILMSASLFAFILSMMSFDIDSLPSSFDERLPVKFLGGFQILIACAIGMLWLQMIITSVASGKSPGVLEHYTTLVIQGMDLGIVVPAAFLSGVLLLKRKPYGYLLSSVIIIKGITMLTSITAMVIAEALAGVKMDPVVAVVFPLFNLVMFYCLALVMKNIKEPESSMGGKA